VSGQVIHIRFDLEGFHSWYFIYNTGQVSNNRRYIYPAYTDKAGNWSYPRDFIFLSFNFITRKPYYYQSGIPIDS
jgi:hypothetical protein